MWGKGGGKVFVGRGERQARVGVGMGGKDTARSTTQSVGRKFEIEGSRGVPGRSRGCCRVSGSEINFAFNLADVRS